MVSYTARRRCGIFWPLISALTLQLLHINDWYEQKHFLLQLWLCICKNIRKRYVYIQPICLYIQWMYKRRPFLKDVLQNMQEQTYKSFSTSWRFLPEHNERLLQKNMFLYNKWVVVSFCGKLSSFTVL